MIYIYLLAHSLASFTCVLHIYTFTESSRSGARSHPRYRYTVQQLKRIFAISLHLFYASFLYSVCIFATGIR